MVRRHQQTFARAELSGKIEHRLVHASTPDGHAVDIERQAVDQIKAARAQFYDIARFGEDQGFLKSFLGIGTGRDGNGFCE